MRKGHSETNSGLMERKEAFPPNKKTGQKVEMGGEGGPGGRKSQEYKLKPEKYKLKHRCHRFCN